MGGDKAQHILWRVLNNSLPKYAPNIVIIAGGNNLNNDPPTVIADAVVNIAQSAQSKCRFSKIYVVGENIWTSIKSKETNDLIKYKCAFFYINFIPIDPRFFEGDTINKKYYWIDGVHLNECGYSLYGEMMSHINRASQQPTQHRFIIGDDCTIGESEFIGAG